MRPTHNPPAIPSQMASSRSQQSGQQVYYHNQTIPSVNLNRLSQIDSSSSISFSKSDNNNLSDSKNQQIPLPPNQIVKQQYSERNNQAQSPRQNRNIQPSLTSQSMNRSNSYKEIPNSQKPDNYSINNFQISKRVRDNSREESSNFLEEGHILNSVLKPTEQLQQQFESPNKNREKQDNILYVPVPQQQQIYNLSPPLHQKQLQHSHSASRQLSTSQVPDQNTINYSAIKQRQNNVNLMSSIIHHHNINNTSNLYQFDQQSRIIQQESISNPQFPKDSQIAPPRISLPIYFEEEMQGSLSNDKKNSSRQLIPPVPQKQNNQVKIIGKQGIMQPKSNENEPGQNQILILQQSQKLANQSPDLMIPFGNQLNNAIPSTQQTTLKREQSFGINPLRQSQFQQTAQTYSQFNIPQAITVQQPYHFQPQINQNAIDITSQQQKPNLQQQQQQPLQNQQQNIQKQQSQQKLKNQKQTNEQLEAQNTLLKITQIQLNEMEKDKKESEIHQQELEKIIKMLIQKNEQLSAVIQNHPQQTGQLSEIQQNKILKNDEDLAHAQLLVQSLRAENELLKKQMSSKSIRTEDSEMLSILEKRIEELVKENERVNQNLEQKETMLTHLQKQLQESQLQKQREDSLQKELMELVSNLERKNEDSKAMINELSQQVNEKKQNSQVGNQSVALKEEINFLHDDNRRLVKLLDIAEEKNIVLFKENQAFSRNQSPNKEKIIHQNTLEINELKAEIDYWKHKFTNREKKTTPDNVLNAQTIDLEKKLRTSKNEQEKLSILLSDQSNLNSAMKMPPPFLQMPDRR